MGGKLMVGLTGLTLSSVIFTSCPRGEISLAGVWKKWFALGAAVSQNKAGASPRERELLTKNFSLLVAENEMKAETVQPAEGRFNWEPAEAIIDFAESNGMALRWHTLVWHNQCPPWFFQDKNDPSRQVSRETLNERLETHIKTIVSRYKGRIASYDVVNEVLSDRSGLRKGDERSLWYEILGPEYIDNAFRWAREADPDAQLVINDYNLESSPRKRQEMYDLVKGMKERKVPVDAVGIQAHIDIKNPQTERIRETIELFASLGVKVVVTELDMSIYTSEREPQKEPSPDLLREQAERYREIFIMLKEQAEKGNLGGMVVFWGTADNTSWKNNFPVPGRADAPLLFDRQLREKPAYRALLEAP
jgi:endo-1,4-beta-xylanase